MRGGLWWDVCSTHSPRQAHGLRAEVKLMSHNIYQKILRVPNRTKRHPIPLCRVSFHRAVVRPTHRSLLFPVLILEERGVWCSHTEHEGRTEGTERARQTRATVQTTRSFCKTVPSDPNSIYELTHIQNVHSARNCRSSPLSPNLSDVIFGKQ